MRVVCEDASIGLFGVLETQAWALPGREFRGVGVLRRMMMMMIFLLRYALRRAGPATAIYKGNRTIKAG
jgi:hypothetical protein